MLYALSNDFDQIAKGHIEPELFDEFLASKVTMISELAIQVRNAGGDRDVAKAIRNAKSCSLSISPTSRGGAGIGAHNEFVAIIDDILA
jgi:hypothetical protein